MVQDLFVESNDAAHEPTSDKHLAADFPLGIEGFTYGDLHRPARLRALAEAFYAEVEGADAGLHARLAEYVAARGENLKGTRAESELLIEAAPHLSRFVARLFRIEEERERLAESIRAQEPVFQFKQFVQRRATKSFPAERAAAVDLEAADAALERLRHAAFADTLADDRELGVARMAVRLLEWEKNYPKEGVRQEEVWSDERARVAAAAAARLKGTEVEALLAAWRTETVESVGDETRAFVRASLRLLEAWSAAHASRPEARERVKGWVSFRFPHPLDYEHLVQIERPRAGAARADARPGEEPAPPRRLQADRHALHAARGAERDPLLRLCHERDKDSCSKGFATRTATVARPTRSASRWPAARSTRRSPRCTSLRKRRRRRSARWRIVMHRQPDVPGHRPPHLQRLHEGLHLPEAGAGQHPADRDRRADRRARAAVGRRDLRAADALEPAERPAPVRAAVQRQERAGRRPRARPATRWRTTC